MQNCIVKQSIRTEEAHAETNMPAAAKKTPAKKAWKASRSISSYNILRKNYAISSESLSRLTGAAPRTVAYWSAGNEPQRSNQQKLKELVRLFDALSDIVQPKAIGPWLLRPNPAFDGSTPLQVIERGEGDRIWRMIWELREGNSG